MQINEKELVEIRKMYLQELIDGDLDKQKSVDKFIIGIIEYIKTNKLSKELKDSKFLIDYLSDNFKKDFLELDEQYVPFADRKDASVSMPFYKNLYVMLNSWKSKEEQLLEWKDKYIRLYADMENNKKEFSNYQKRVSHEKYQIAADTKWKVLSDITSIVEDFDRAKSTIENSDNSTLQGLNLIYQKFETFLTKNNVSKVIPTKGDTFNPDNMECLVTIDNSEYNGKVFDIVKNGWMVNDKIVSYPQVVVGK